MNVMLYGYEKCSTCKKAQKWLDDNNIVYDCQDFVQTKLTRKQVVEISSKSELPLRRFFNTSGIKYRELGLASKMDQLSDDEKYDLLASDGKLIKRPLLVVDNKTICVGFNDEIWRQALNI